MLTSPFNVHPLTPHFYIGKLGFYRGIHYFPIFALKHRLLVHVKKKQIYVLSKNKKNINFSSENYHFYSYIKSHYTILHRRVNC